MSVDELVKVLPFVVALVSLLVTAGLGYANYRLTRDKTQMDREKFAHDRAMVFWDKKVEAYSRAWSSVTTAYEEYAALSKIAADPLKGLHTWLATKRVNEKVADDDASFAELERRVAADPVRWLPWLLDGRRVKFDELENLVRKDHFYLAPDHRALIAQIFDACRGLRDYTTLDEFRSTYQVGLEIATTAYARLRDDIDETFYR